jgi:hypothetical protein
MSRLGIAAKFAMFGLALGTALVALPATADAHRRHWHGGGPRFVFAPGFRPYYPPPVYYARPPVYYAPPPVYYRAPPPAYYAPPPGYYAPGPMGYADPSADGYAPPPLAYNDVPPPPIGQPRDQ